MLDRDSVSQTSSWFWDRRLLFYDFARQSQGLRAVKFLNTFCPNHSMLLRAGDRRYSPQILENASGTFASAQCLDVRKWLWDENLVQVVTTASAFVKASRSNTRRDFCGPMASSTTLRVAWTHELDI